MDALKGEFGLAPSTRVLDVGGTTWNWLLGGVSSRITLFNLNLPSTESSAPPSNMEYQLGDGRELPYADRSYDVAFSNSVIEHLGAFEDQRRFAAELSRVGRGLWVQTPARSFPIECHLLTPFVHFLPQRWQRAVARWGTVWGWLSKPTPEQVDALIGELRLLTFDEMQELFPDCEIRRERFLGFTKSYIAVRGARQAA
jgi:hypothetical protein